MDSSIASSATCPPARDSEDQIDMTQSELSEEAEALASYAAYDEDDPIFWSPEMEVAEDPLLLESQRKKLPRLPIQIHPSQFVHIAFRMPREDGLGYEKFSFDGRRHITRPYNSSAPRILLQCARQVEKSTLIGNILLTNCCLIPAFKGLYVSPSSMQSKTFSNDRIKEPIETSPILKGYTTTSLSQNVFEKQFVNRSKITIRYAFLNADRTRGIPAWKVAIDEIQDILSENIPVIERCADHAPRRWRSFLYSGTPKSLDNTIEYYRSNKSTQGEWVVPCDCKGGEGGRFWNILGEKNIGRKLLICERCGKQLHPMCDEAQWAHAVEFDPDKMFESFRISQLMVPWKKWPEVLYDYETMPRAQFYNEVLGISFDSGLRPLTLTQIKDACNQAVTMHPDVLETYRQLGHSQPIFMGIDWGTGENTYTVVTLATYIDMKYRVFYVHRCVGDLIDPTPQLNFICGLVRRFNVRVIGTDYGGGFDRNDHLMRKFGSQRLVKFQYMARSKKKVEWDPRLLRYKCHRTEVMSDVFNAIKRHQFEFPRWEEFHAEGRAPYALDMLNIFSEYNETLKMIMYKHAPDKPDDTFHSLLYGFLGSMIVVPRPDIIAPRRELPGRHPIQGGGWTPLDQG